jgi:hypothetical protein
MPSPFLEISMEISIFLTSRIEKFLMKKNKEKWVQIPTLPQIAHANEGN